MTHDYIRHGTTTLFAALNVLDGSVIGQCMARHRHQEFIRFLNRVEAAVPAGKLIHAILDNYAAHKHPKVRAWLTRHPRWTFHFTPTSCSWLNAVETFFATLTRRRLQRGAFHSLVDLQAAINRYLDRAQPAPQALHLDRRPQPHHRKGQPRAPSVGVRPLALVLFIAANLAVRFSSRPWRNQLQAMEMTFFFCHHCCSRASCSPSAACRNGPKCWVRSHR